MPPACAPHCSELVVPMPHGAGPLCKPPSAQRGFFGAVGTCQALGMGLVGAAGAVRVALVVLEGPGHGGISEGKLGEGRRAGLALFILCYMTCKKPHCRPFIYFYTGSTYLYHPV